MLMHGGRWVLAVVFVFGMFALSQFAPRPVHPQEQANYYSDHQTYNEPVTVIETSDDKIARYTLWLAILTGALAAVSIYQGVMLNRADQTARISANAAKVSADAVKSTADALPKVERAYLFPFSDIERDIRFTTDSTIIFKFANLGKTAAVITQISRHFAYLPRNLGPESISVPWVDLNTPMPVASGTHSEPFTARTIITAPQYDDAERGFGSLVLIVRVAYLDIFNERHETAFCQHKSGSWGWLTWPSDRLNYRT
jgi:hypothetical protein